MTSPALEPLFKIFFTCLKISLPKFSFHRLKFPGKITEKFMENLKQATGKIEAQLRAAP